MNKKVNGGTLSNNNFIHMVFNFMTDSKFCKTARQHGKTKGLFGSKVFLQFLFNTMVLGNTVVIYVVRSLVAFLKTMFSKLWYSRHHVIF
jgi:hypothetical protein